MEHEKTNANVKWEKNCQKYLTSKMNVNRKEQTIVKKRLWKQVTAFVMACAVITGTAGTNTAFAAGNENNIAAASLPQKIVKDNDIAKNRKAEGNTPELNKILEECKTVEQDGSSNNIRKGQILSGTGVSSVSMSGDYAKWRFILLGI